MRTAKNGGTATDQGQPDAVVHDDVRRADRRPRAVAAQEANLTAALVKGQYEQQIKLYREMLDNVRSDLNGLNAQVGGHARALVEQRKQKLLGDRAT